MRNNLFSMRSLLIAAPLFLVSVLPLKAVPWSAEVQQELNINQHQTTTLNLNVFEVNFDGNAFSAFAPEVDCLNTSRYPSGVILANDIPSPVTISTCNFAGEYAEIGAIVSGNQYSFTSSLATDYITIRIGTSNGPILGQGIAPVVVTATSTQNLFMHLNSDANCGTVSGCRTTTVTCVSCTPPPACSTPTISSFPFTETFENTSDSRQCWTNEIISGSSNWVYRKGAFSGTVTTAHGGTLNAAFTATNYNGHSARLISPKFDLTDKENATLSFWYANEAWSSDQNELRVFYKVGTGAWTLIPDAEFTSNVSAWTEATFNLPDSDGEADYTIAFVGVGDWARGVVVDDVTVDADDSTSAPAGCLTAQYGQFPSTTVTPLCNGQIFTVTSAGWASEYSKVNLIAGTEYTFSSSVTTDFITISDDAGTEVKASGITPVVYTPTADEVVRFYVHKDASCTSENVSRSRLVTCGAPIVIEEPDFDCFQGDGITSSYDNGFSVRLNSPNRAADNFFVEEDIEFTMQQITIDALSTTAITSATINIREDNAGAPGAVIETVTMAPSEIITYATAFNFPIHHLVFDLATPIVLTEGTYWLEPSILNANDSNVFWLATSTGSHGAIINRSTDTGATWTPDSTNLQGVFFVAGECEATTGGGTEDGETCETAMVVTSLPYDHAGNTSDYGNDYTNSDVPALATGAITTGTGSAYYLSGDDVVYAYTPIEDQLINVTTTNDDDWIGLWAFTGCPFNSTVGYHTATSGTTRMINSLPVTAGTTYYFVISTWNPPMSTDYTIHIEVVGGGGNDDDCDQGDDSNGFENGYNITAGGAFRSADDFIVSAGNTLEIEQIEINVFANDPIQTMSFIFYEDDGGKPGSTIAYNLSSIPVESVAIGSNFGFTVYGVYADVSLSFTEGTYWMEAVADGGTAYWEITTVGTLGQPIHRIDTGSPWTADPDGGQGVFKLHCDAVEIPGGNDCMLSFNNVEAITRVLFADIDNTSPASSTIQLEDFTAIEGNVGTGDTYPIALEGNTDGPWTNYFTVWIDWNQNGTYEVNEKFQVGTIVNSTGTDGQQATGNIAVPNSAMLGTTTMRVIKSFGSYPQDPCGTYSYGQAEDYTINVTEGSGGNTGYTCEDNMVPSNNLENGLFFGGTTNQKLAVDVMVGDDGFPVYGVELNVFTDGNTDLEFMVTFYEDNAGLPGAIFEDTGFGTIVSSEYIGEAFNFDIYKFKVAFDAPVNLSANTTYWMEVESDGVAWEATSASNFGSPNAFANDSTSGAWTMGSLDLVYALVCEELGVSDMNSFDFAYYPNPVKDVLNITSQKAVKSVEAFNLTGQKVLSNANALNGQINVSALTAGTYVFKVTLEDGQVETFKIIKK